MTALSISRAMSGDPIPAKSQQLFMVQIDSWGPDQRGERNEDGLDENLSYIDAMALNDLHGARRQTRIYSTYLNARSEDPTVDLQADQKTPSAHISYYFGDEQALDTLGVKLIAGRNFSASEILDRDGSSSPPATDVIITRTLAQRLFPRGDALGKSIYTESKDPSPIIGIIDRLQGPFVAATGLMSTFTENAVLAPFRALGDSSTYVVRTMPGSRAEVLKAAQNKLELINGSRIIGTHAMSEIRAGAYRSNRGLTLMLGAVAFILVAVTAFGMSGLTSYWVAQRSRQIGIRRALGATRMAILRLFHGENFLIALSGVLVGILLAVFLNIWLVGRFEMVRLNPSYVVGSGIAMLLLGQIAVLWPAMRAAQVPPALAKRSSQVS